jgi:hypothetical protein
MPSTGRPAADVIETGKLREAGAADRLVCRSTVVVDFAFGAVDDGESELPATCDGRRGRSYQSQDETMHCLDLA